MTKHSHHFVWAGNSFVCSYCGKKSKLKRTPPIVKIVCIVAFFIVGLLILSNSYVNSSILSTTENLKQKIIALSNQFPSSNPNLQTDQSNNNTTTNQQTVTVKMSEPTAQPEQTMVSSNDASAQTTQTTQQVTQNQPASQSIYSQQELYEYALQLINEDRAKNGLSPVNLGNNQAAQAQADDMLKFHQLSHWMSTGEKPYMSYTRFGGLGNVGQNAAGYNHDDIQGCYDGTSNCATIDAMEEIKQHEDSMMNNDLACCNNGHRDNILDKHHTDVSIGISYDQYSLWMIQNFENNYIDYTLPISENNGIVSFAGNLKSGSLLGVDIFYDPLPSIDIYQQHKNDGNYTQGDHLVTVQPPPQAASYYPPTTNTFEVADKWIQQGSNVNVSFDISPFVTRSGVYTIYVTLQDNNGDQFPVTSYSIIKNSPMVQDGFKSPKVYYACTSTQLNQYNQLQQQLEPLNHQYDTLQTQYNSRPQTASSDQEYQQDMQMYNQLNSLSNQINSLQNQMENFRC
jgi:uncharacterized protein YkwD